jgi:diacylglycerol kinase family enzyme
VLVNANAGRVRAHPDMLSRLRQLVPDERLRLTASPDEIEPALRDLRDAGIEALAIVGGDGTVTSSLTALLRVWPHDDLPRVALLPGGSVNTIPRAFSGGAFPDRTLRRMLRPGERPPEVRRTPLRVRATGEPERYGFIFGNGALVRWLDLYHAQAQRGIAGAAAVLARSLSSLAVNGRLARGLFERFAARVEIDGVLRSERRFSAMAAAGLPDIGLGFRPFYLAGAEPGHIHWVMTDAGALQLGLEIPAARFGLRNPRTRLEDASAKRVVIRSKPLAYTIDGDVFQATEELEISAGPDMWFLNLV